MKIFFWKRIPFPFYLFFMVFSGSVLFQANSQEIITADRYMDIVSQHYGTVRDYEARIEIQSGGTNMTGQLSFLNPSFLRIDFSRPAEQVICYNGDLLTVYLPDYRVTLNQEASGGRAVTGASMASAQGLILLRRGYVPSFVSGPEPIPLDDGSSERVIKLRLTRRSISESYREIILSINPETLLIRRIEGRTVTDAYVRFDFSNIRTNLGIPPGRFIYDSPASANMVNNFMFRDTD